MDLLWFGLLFNNYTSTICQNTKLANMVLIVINMIIIDYGALMKYYWSIAPCVPFSEHEKLKKVVVGEGF